MIDFQYDIEQCIAVLQQGGLILYPTDTVWGIGCDATNEEAVKKIYALKQRPDHKAMLVLVAEEKDVLKYVASPDLEVFNYLNNTGKPTTVIYNGAIGLAANLTPTDGTIAIRITKDIFCRHLIKRLRKPIVSTSANLAQQKHLGRFADIPDEIRNGVDYIVKYRQEDETIAEPSSIIKWDNGKITVIRP
jgi:L-threonylcarbamoyladenylate synthase